MDVRLRQLVNPAKSACPASSRILPQLIDEYKQDTTKPVGDELFRYLCNWIRNLETRHYGYKQHTTDKKLSFRIDRVLLFLQMVRENSNKDAALLMFMFSIRMPKVEAMLHAERWGTALTDKSLPIVMQLDSTPLRHYRVVSEARSHTPYSRNTAEVWAERYVEEKGKLPGKRAANTFTKCLNYYERVVASKRELEHSWTHRS